MAADTAFASDQSLIQRYAATGDESAFAELVSRHGQMVYRACCSLAGEAEAEDCTQATFFALAQKARTIRSSIPIASWLYTAARYASLAAVRERATRLRIEEEAGEMQDARTTAPGLSPDAQIDLAEAYACLDYLSERQRQAVLLRHFEGRSEKEAAEIAGCAPTAMSKRASDGIARMRSRLVRRGTAVGAIALVALLGSEASATVPASLLDSACSVCTTASGTAAEKLVSGSVRTITEGAFRMMTHARLMTLAAASASAIVAATVVTLVFSFAPAPARGDPQKPADSVPTSDAQPGLGDSRSALEALRIEIIPHGRYKPGETQMHLDSDIHLVLHNDTDSPVSIWEEWCSWGYNSVAVELTSPEGTVHRLGRGPKAWTVNGPSPFSIRGHDSYVWPINLKTGNWMGVPWNKIANHAVWKMKVTFMIGKGAEAKSHDIWTGSVQSTELAFKAYLRRD